MGTLLSCHRSIKICQTVSTQATDCVVPLQPSDCVKESVVVGQEIQKTIVTEINMGNGDLALADCTELEYPIRLTASKPKENKSRRGVRLMSPERIEISKNAGIARPPLKYSSDYMLLPGQVSPKDESPVLTARVEKVNGSGEAVRSCYNKPNNSSRSVVSKCKIPENQSEGKNETSEQSQLLQDPQATRVNITPARKIVVINEESYQDLNANIVNAGKAVTQCLNPEAKKPIPAAKATAERVQPIKANPRCATVGYESRYPRGSAPEPHKLIPCRTDRPLYLRNSGRGRMLPNQDWDFTCSLEEAFNDNVPCSDEILEPAAVTGTPSSRLRQASFGTYPVSYVLKMTMSGYGGDGSKTLQQPSEYKTSNWSPQLGGGGEGGGGAAKPQEKDGQEDDGDRPQPQEERHNSGYKHGAATSYSLSNGDTDSTDQPRTLHQADPSTEANAVQHSAAAKVDGPATEAVESKQVFSLDSDLSDSPDASYEGSSKSTISTDADQSQTMRKLNVTPTIEQSPFDKLPLSVRGTVKRVCEKDSNLTLHVASNGVPTVSTHHCDQPAKQAAEVSKTLKSSEPALNAAAKMEERKSHITYEAVEEAVSLAIRKLKIMQAGDLRQTLGMSDMSIDKAEKSEGAVALNKAANSLPEATCHVQQIEKTQSPRVVESGEVCAERDSQAVKENSADCPPAQGTRHGEVPSSTTCHNEQSFTEAGFVKAHGHRSRNTDSTDATIQEEDGPSEQDSDIIPLHRVFGQTNLCATPASYSPLELPAFTLRSLPFSARSPFTETETYQIQTEMQPNALPEDQLISMALRKSQRIVPRSIKYMQLEEAEDGGNGGKGSEQLRPSKEKPCSENEIQKDERASNSGIPGKPHRRQMTTQEYLLFSEDVLQHLDTDTPAEQATSSSEVVPFSSTTNDNDSLSLSPVPNDTTDNVRSARSVPRDPDITWDEDKPEY